MNDKDLRGLVVAILGDISDTEVSFILTGLFKLAEKTIKFEPFAIIFFCLKGEIAVARYSKNHGISAKTLNKD